MADARFDFNVDTSKADKAMDRLADRADALDEDLRKPTPVNVDTKPAEKQLASLAGMAKAMFSAEAFSRAGEFMSGWQDSIDETRLSLAKLQGQTGMNADEADAFAARARTAFRDGVGGSVAEALSAMATAKQQLGEFLSPEDLSAFTQSAAGIGRTFDMDVNEVIGKSRTFIAQFGLGGKEAGDLLSLAMQKAGNSMGDVLDTTDEYSQLMKTAGFNAQEFVGILTTGIQAGVRDTDKLADAMKETQIRLKAGDITTALKGISDPVAATIQAIVTAGEQGKKSAKEVMLQSAEAIEQAFDAGKISETVRSKLQIAISGTPAEDIGTEMYGRIFAAPIDTAQIQAAAAQAGEQVAASLGSQNIFQSVLKDVEAMGSQAAAALGPFVSGAGSVLTTAGQLTPALSALGEKFGGEAGLAGMVSKGGGALKAFALGPIGLTLGAVAAVAGGLALLGDALSESGQEALDAANAEKEYNDKQIASTRAAIDHSAKVRDLASRYETLATKTKRTKEEEAELSGLADALNTSYPGLISNTTDYATSLSGVTEVGADATSQLVEMTVKMAQLDAQAQEIAIRTRGAQRRIIQENLVEELFTATAGAGDKVVDWVGRQLSIDKIFGTTGTARSIAQRLAGEFSNTLKAAAMGMGGESAFKDAAGRVRKRVGELFPKSVDSGAYLSVMGVADKLIESYGARFEKPVEIKMPEIKLTPTTTTTTTTPVTPERLLSIAGLDKLQDAAFERTLGEAFMRALGFRDDGSLANFQREVNRAVSEAEVIAVEYENGLKRIARKHEAERKAITDQLTDAKGKPKLMDNDLRDRLEKGLKEIDKQISDETQQLDRWRDDQLTRYAAFVARLAEINTRTAVDVSPIAPLRLVKSNAQFALEREIADLREQQHQAFRDLDPGDDVDAYLAKVNDLEDRIREATRKLAAATAPDPAAAEETGNAWDHLYDGLVESLVAQQGLLRAFYDSTDEMRREQLEKDLKGYRKEEADLRLSLLRKSISLREFDAKMAELSAKRSEAEDELAGSTALSWESMQQSAAKVFASLSKQFSAQFQNSVKDVGKSKDKTLAALADMGAAASAIFMQSLAEEKNAYIETANFLIDSSLQMLLANQAQLIFGIFGKTMAELGPWGLPAFLGLSATLGILAATAKSLLSAARPREHGGPIYGRNTYVANDDPHGRTEWIVDGRSTATNRPLLEWMRSNPGRDLAQHLVAESHAQRSLELAAVMAHADRVAGETRGMAETMGTEIRRLGGRVDVLTATVRQGIPIRGTSGVTGDQIRTVYETANRRAMATR